MYQLLWESWYVLLTLLSIAIAIVATLHVVLRKEDPRAAIGWVGVIWLAPFLGSLLYYLFGINRIERRATRIRSGLVRPRSKLDEHELRPPSLSPEQLGPLFGLVQLGGRLAQEPLLAGNSLEPLIGGDEAFPAMIRAIDQAVASVTLATYIFDNDRAGKQFVDALARARRRGVEIRVLIDDVGRRYSWPSVTRLLRNANIPYACFMPTLRPGYFRYSNLRNHRKIMVADGKVAFTGGMNIRAGNYSDAPARHAIRDLHFRIEGPVAHQLQNVFAMDWHFTTGELLQGDRWYGTPIVGGTTLCRAIVDGPDEDLQRLPRLLHGAISVAQRSLTIVTPYFLPDLPLITVLCVAALRGVRVDIVLPARSNLRLVQWASSATLPPLLEAGCHVWLSPPPFDHSKMFIVDQQWAMIGSPNWDQRSLRLNFEIAVECYDRHFVSALARIADKKMAAARPLTLTMLQQQPLWQKVRNGFARLGAPYL